jgi:hypothetical protein
MIPEHHASVAKRWLFLPFAIFLGLATCNGLLHGANGQGLKTNVNETGVRHALIAAIEADKHPAISKEDPETSTATVDVLLRILNYATDYRFVGVVDGKFPSFDPAKGAEAQEVWIDERCHQYRGLPRIWVLGINGRITRNETVFDVVARPRHVGELVPKDEIIMHKDRNTELDDPNQSLVTVATTTASRLNVRLTVKSTRCRLNKN